MNGQTLTRLRAEAKAQLLNYRRNRSRAFRRAEQHAQAGAVQEWVRAIDEARACIRAADATKERFMCRMFGLEAPIPRGQSVRERMIKLSMELCVSESTLYKWREDILSVVLFAAIEADLIRPFALRARGSADGETGPERGPDGGTR